MAGKYYEKRGKNVPIWWKVAHISLYLILFVLGLVNFIPFGTVEWYFNGSCPLYSNYTLKLVKNDTYSVLTKVNKGAESTCSFVLYTGVCTSIYAFILAWFYVLCGRGGDSDKGLPKPWRLVFPTCLFSFVFAIVSLVASVYLSNGFSYFCKSIEASPDVESCSLSDDKSWIRYPHIKGFFTTLVLAEASSWCITSFWILSFLILLARCCYPADFNVVRDKDDDEKKNLHEELEG